jgi:transposase
MGAYSQDLRERVLKAIEAGASDIEAGKRYGVHRNTVWRYRRRWEEDGERKARSAGGQRPSQFEGHDQTLRRWAQGGNITLGEMAVKCREELGIEVVPQTIWHRLQKLGLSHKKKSAGSGAGPGRR